MLFRKSSRRTIHMEASVVNSLQPAELPLWLQTLRWYVSGLGFGTTEMRHLLMVAAESIQVLIAFGDRELGGRHRVRHNNQD